MKEIEKTITTEFIKLDALLKFAGIADTGIVLLPEKIMIMNVG